MSGAVERSGIPRPGKDLAEGAGQTGPLKPNENFEGRPHRVVTDKGWSYVVGPTIAGRDGPWRYGWEAQELADKLNARSGGAA